MIIRRKLRIDNELFALTKKKKDNLFIVELKKMYEADETKGTCRISILTILSEPF